MINKELFDIKEVQERQNNHLDRTIKELGYIEIPKTEYKHLKYLDPKNVNAYTIRIRFKYYKKSKTFYNLKDDDELIMTGKQLREFKEFIIKAIREGIL